MREPSRIGDPSGAWWKWMLDRSRVVGTGLGVVVVALALRSSMAVADPPVKPGQLAARVAELKAENAHLRSRLLWWELMFEPSRPAQATVTLRMPMDGRPSPEDLDHLKGLDLPKHAPTQLVQRFVAKVLRAASEHRALYHPADPETDLLRRVGPLHVDVLVDALLHRPGHVTSLYLVEALKTLVNESHKRLILDRLGRSHDLVEVVTAKGWSEDAAPTLLKVLAERSPYLSIDWLQAAVPYARAEDYDALKFQFLRGSNPRHVWEAIRHLPGMEPLDELVADAWKRPHPSRTPDSWQMRNVAIVAAYYGHLDALDAIVSQLARNESSSQDAFLELTGYPGDSRRAEWPREAQEWFAAHRAALVYDRSKMRYTFER